MSENDETVERVGDALQAAWDGTSSLPPIIFQPHEREALARAAIAAMPERGGWQPIETAPRDGTAFVGTDGRYAYRTKLGQYYVKWPHQEGGPTFEDRWNAEDSSSIWPWNPTHWQPLPTPPESAS